MSFPSSVERRILFPSPLGALVVSVAGGRLVGVELAVEGAATGDAFVPGEEGLLDEIGRQLTGYFADPKAGFDLPLAPRGTIFQSRVWAALREIPVGEVRTYGDLARQLGSSPRAVGGACRANPIPVIVPCHRVVAQSGIGGYSGATEGRRLDTKRWLLEHEGVSV